MADQPEPVQEFDFGDGDAPVELPAASAAGPAGDEFIAHDAAQDLVVDTTGWMPVPGLYHAVHNSVAELAQSMKFYSPFCKQLKAVCDLARRKFSRQRLLETCFSEAPASYSRHLFEGFSSAVYEGRWGTVADAVTAVGPLRVAFQHWNVSLFNRGKPIGHEGGHEWEGPRRR